MIAAWKPLRADQRESDRTLLDHIGVDLAQRLHELRLDVQRDARRRLEMGVGALLSSLAAEIDRLARDELSNPGRGMLRNVAFDIACLRWPIPRFSCLLPAHEGVLPEADRSYSSWSARLWSWCHSRTKVSGRMVGTKLRLFFLCAHDLSLAKCGPGGQGYEVKTLLQCVNKETAVSKMRLALGSIALKICTALTIPIHEVDFAFGDTLGGVISEIVKEEACTVATAMESNKVENLKCDDNAEQLRQADAAPKARIRRFNAFHNLDVMREPRHDLSRGRTSGERQYPLTAPRSLLCCSHIPVAC